MRHTNETVSRTDAGATSSRRPLRLIVSAHFVHAGRVGGSEHMLYNLLRGLSRHCADLIVVCASERNLDAVALASLRQEPRVQVVETGTHRVRFFAEQQACMCRDLAGDMILFPNYFVPPVTPRRLGRVATVLHDLQYLHYPRHFSARKRAWLHVAQQMSVRKADRVVVISEFVRQDVVRHFGKAFEHKLALIPNPIDWGRFEGARTTASPLDRPYVLSVAAQYPHKNLGVLIRAFAAVAKRNRDLHLVLCGQDFGSLVGSTGLRTSLESLVDGLGIGGRVRLTGYVTDEALGRWYRHASLFAFPSIFEGFGMPAVEALGFGVPTLTTRRTAIPETTLGLATYVDDPFSVGEWAACIEEVARDPERFRPQAAGVARLLARYDVERVAGEYARL